MKYDEIITISPEGKFFTLIGDYGSEDLSAIDMLITRRGGYLTPFRAGYTKYLVIEAKSNNLEYVKECYNHALELREEGINIIIINSITLLRLLLCGNDTNVLMLDGLAMKYDEITAISPKDKFFTLIGASFYPQDIIESLITQRGGLLNSYFNTLTHYLVIDDEDRNLEYSKAYVKECYNHALELREKGSDILIINSTTLLRLLLCDNDTNESQDEMELDKDHIIEDGVSDELTISPIQNFSDNANTSSFYRTNESGTDEVEEKILLAMNNIDKEISISELMNYSSLHNFDRKIISDSLHNLMRKNKMFRLTKGGKVYYTLDASAGDSVNPIIKNIDSKLNYLEDLFD